MSDTPVMKKAKILREFNDAGTEKRYFAGQEHELPVGVFENYRVAGLVEEITDTVAASADADTAKTGGKRV